MQTQKLEALQMSQTLEELERFHYITNSPQHHMYARMIDLQNQVSYLEEQVEELEERIEELEN